MTIHTDNSKVIENLQKENAELNETIEANLRVNKAAEKADAERIWNLQKENAELRNCLKESIQWLADISAEVVGNEPAKQIDELVSWMKTAIAKASGEKAAK